MINVDPNQVVQSYAQSALMVTAVALVFSIISRIIGHTKLIYQRRKY